MGSSARSTCFSAWIASRWKLAASLGSRTSIPFEWAGTYELVEGTYELVLGEGPDPAMDLLFQALSPNENAHHRPASDRALRAWSQGAAELSPVATLDALVERPTRLLLATPGFKRFQVRVPRAARLGLYTQHLPAEFTLELRRQGAALPLAPLAEREFAASHTHDAEVSSVGIHLDGAIDQERLNKWLSQLLREKGTDIFRMKGIIDLKGAENRFDFQGVHMLFDGREDRPWGSDARASDLVFVGRNLDREELTRGFQRCLA